MLRRGGNLGGVWWLFELVAGAAEGLHQLRRLWSEPIGDMPRLAGYDWDAHVEAYARGSAERAGLSFARQRAGVFVARGSVRGVPLEITWSAETHEESENSEVMTAWMGVAMRSPISPRAQWVARARARAGATQPSLESVPLAPPWLPFALGSSGGRALKELRSRGTVVLDAGALSWSARTRVMQLGVIQALIEHHVTLAGALQQIEREPPGELARAAREDGDPETRAGAIGELLRLAPDGPEAQAALDAGLEDASPAVAIAAAAWVPARGASRLIAIAADATKTTPVRARAIEVLGRVRDRDDVRHTVIDALGTPALFAAALGALAQLRHPEGTVALLAAVRDRAVAMWSEDTALALARGLESAGESAEPVLIQLLAHPRARVIATAARALAPEGGARALAALEAAAKARPAPPASEALAQSIAAIRARLPQSGSLTLAKASDAQGAVTVADPGGVSIVSGDD